MPNVLDKRDKTIAPVPRGVGPQMADKYKWAKPTAPGRYALVNKNLLNLDDTYQRNAKSQGKILDIARDWDWSLFGVLKIAERPDKTLWIFDGGHRARASFYRADILELPCLIFDMGDVGDEARAFLGGSRLSSSIRSYDQFKAAFVAKEPTAMKTMEVIHACGLVPAAQAHRSNEIGFLNTLQSAMEMDAGLAKSVLELCILLCNDEPVNGPTFKAIFTLANHFGGQSFVDTRLQELLAHTQRSIMKVVQQFKAEVGKAGNVVEAKAIMGLLNKGKKTRKLTW